MNDIDVTVWYAVLPVGPATFSDSLAGHLTAEERAQADRFVFNGDKYLFTASRALFRHALRAHTGFSNWATQTGHYGKPELVPTEGTTTVHFNMSRTDQLVSCAISSRHSVGVDVEIAGKISNFSALVERYYSPAERDYLSSCASPQREAAFLQIWTIKEAISKAIGGGLTIPLADIQIGLDPVCLSFAPHLKLDATKWQIEQFKPTAEHQIALAVLRSAGKHSAVAWRSVDLTDF